MLLRPIRRFDIEVVKNTVLLLAVLAGTPFAALAQPNPFDGKKSGGRSYTDPAVYAQNKAQWLARVAARPESVDVLEGAADFFLIFDRLLALELLEQARGSSRPIRSGSRSWPSFTG
jgi:hypothetical protein